MTRIKIAEIPGKYESYWDDKALCVIDCWKDFHTVTIDEVQKSLVSIVVPFIIQKRCDTHVIDNSRANGAFTREVADYFRDEITALMKTTNIHYFVTVVSENSPLANLSMRSITTQDTIETFYWIETSTVTEGLNSITSLKSKQAAS